MTLKISEPDLLVGAESLVRSLRQLAATKPKAVKEQLLLLKNQEVSYPYGKKLYEEWLERIAPALAAFEDALTRAGDPTAALQAWRKTAYIKNKVTLSRE